MLMGGSSRGLAEAEFVEEVGDIFDQMGSSRIAGRVMGWLLVCEPAHQSASELARAVQASKASMSTVLRSLLAARLVERMGVPGDRRTYYRVKPDAWSEMFQAKLAFNAALRQIAEKGLKLIGAKKTRRSRLEEMQSFYGFLDEEMPAVLERWKARHRRGG
jgi:DNA-binding transcriptional regulator GbsR (MarR family)